MIISHGRLVARDTQENLAKMDGTHGMELTVKADETAALEILEKTDAFEWMTDVVMRQDAETGETEVSFQFEDDGNYEKDIRETVFFAFAQAQVPILAMREKKMSLEDLFLELTGDKKAAEEEQELLDSEEPDSELNDPEKSEEEAEDVNEIEDTIAEADILQKPDTNPDTDPIPDQDSKEATHDSNL